MPRGEQGLINPRWFGAVYEEHHAKGGGATMRDVATYGFPFRGMVAEVLLEPVAGGPPPAWNEKIVHGVRAEWSFGDWPGVRVLPTRIFWPAFILDIILWALLFRFAPYGFSQVARLVKWELGHVRRNRGRCPGCGYRLHGEIGGGCPECGWGRGDADS